MVISLEKMFNSVLKALILNSTHSISKAVQEEALLCKERLIKTAMLNVPVHWQFWPLYNASWPERIYNPITAMGFSAMFTF